MSLSPYAFYVGKCTKNVFASGALHWIPLDSLLSVLRPVAGIRGHFPMRISIQQQTLVVVKPQSSYSHLIRVKKTVCNQFLYSSSSHALQDSCFHFTSHTLGSNCLEKTLWNPMLSEHLLKWCTTNHLYLNRLPHKPQQNCLKSVCISWWHVSSFAVQKRFGHTLHTYGLTPSCRRKCTLS